MSCTNKQNKQFSVNVILCSDCDKNYNGGNITWQNNLQRVGRMFEPLFPYMVVRICPIFMIPVVMVTNVSQQ